MELMAVFEKESPVSCSAEELYDWHAREGAFERLIPPWRKARILSRTGGIETGAEIRVRLKQLGIARDWTARIVHSEPGRCFEDEQVDGPFTAWKHCHAFEETSRERCRLRDWIDYELPGGALGELIAGPYAKRELERIFRYRHAITKSDLSNWSHYRERPRLRILISGGYGFIGSRLTAFLRAQGNQVCILSRRPKPGDIGWDPKVGAIDSSKLEGFDVVMHLAGKNLADGRWNGQMKGEFWRSRVDAGQLLVDALKQVRKPPRVFACASGVGYYGDTGERPTNESEDRGSGFLAELCEGWEGVAHSAEDFAERILILRTGMVVDGGGGALPRMLLPFALGLGGALGTGQQWMPWISLEDWLGATYRLMRERASGAYNLVAPKPCRNAGFAKALGATLKRPAALPVPAALLSLVLGEFADEALLSSCQACPRRLLESGYRFRYPEIGEALAFSLGK